MAIVNRAFALYDFGVCTHVSPGRIRRRSPAWTSSSEPVRPCSRRMRMAILGARSQEGTARTLGFSRARDSKRLSEEHRDGNDGCSLELD